MSASDRGDLTRWNRAGLSRFRYVDGNAATFLEELRLQLASRFPNWAALRRDPLDGESEAQKRVRLLAQYADEGTADYAWEIVRAFARASHVLGEHIDAYANEGFLETATQWDNLRALAAMLDYHPAPPGSASALIVLEAKAGKAGRVEKGFQVQYAPQAGGDPVVFETLADIEIDEALNGLHLAGWNRSEKGFDPLANGEGHWLPDEDMAVTAGSLALLVQSTPPLAAVTRIEAVDPDTGSLSLASIVTTQESEDAGSWIKGSTRLLLEPENIYQAKLAGENVLELADPPGLSPGEVLSWQDNGAWQFGRVTRCDGNRLSLSGDLPPEGSTLYLAFPIQRRAEDELLLIPADTLAVAHLSNGVPDKLDLNDFDAYPDEENISALKLRDRPDHPYILEVLVKDASAELGNLGRVVARLSAPEDWVFAFHGSPADLAGNQWVVGEAGGGGPAWYALRIQSIERLDEGFSIRFQTAAPADSILRKRLGERLRLLELALDETVLAQATLADWVGGKLGRRSASDLKGIGKPGGNGYYERLGGARTITGLAAHAGPAPGGIPAGLWREFITLARLAVRPELGPDDCCGLAGATLADALKDLERNSAGAGAIPNLARLHGPFAYALGPVGFDRNGDVLEGEWLPLDLARGDTVFQRLKPGRNLLIEAAPGRLKEAMVVAVDDGRQGDTATPPAIRIDPPFEAAEGFVYGETLIRANVVPAGHGERRAERLLGSGDGTRLNQSFVFPEAEVAFVADPTQPAGVRADIDVDVDGQTWQQVGNLRNSGPADPHYTVRLTEEGYLKLEFGDGRHGRRLPTGDNNLRISYREGHGLRGNLPAGSLAELVSFHPVVEAASQPLRAIGGADREDIRSLRESAPASLLALERAVSVTDFADLAQSQGNVWQAAAWVDSAVPPTRGQGRRVKVVIVPAGEVQFGPEGKVSPVPDSFIDRQREFLESSAPPGIGVRVEAFRPKLLDIEAVVWIKTREYEPYQVAEAVRTALRQALALKRRKIGRPLHRSELYAIIEAVQGVEHSTYTLFSHAVDDKSGKLGPAMEEPDDVPAAADEVVFVHEDDRYSSLRVSHLEFRP